MKRNTILAIVLCLLLAFAGCAGWGEDGVHDPDAEDDSNADEQEQEQKENQDDSEDNESSDNADTSDTSDTTDTSDESDKSDSSDSSDSDNSDTSDTSDTNESDDEGDAESDDSSPSESDGDNDGDSDADEADGSQGEDSASDEDSDTSGDSPDSSDPDSEDTEDTDSNEEDTTETDDSEEPADEPEEDPEVYTLTVWAGEQRAVTDVDITLERHSDGATTTREVDSNGVVEFRVIDGDYTVSGTSHEGETYTRDVTIDGGDADVTLPLDPAVPDEPDEPEEPEQDPENGGEEQDPETEEPEDPSEMYTQTATVSVRNPSGTPLSGVTVEYGPAGGEPNAETSTNGNGKATVQSRTSEPDDATMLDVTVNDETKPIHATTSGDDTVEFVIEPDD